MKTRARCVRTRMRLLGLPAVVVERGLTSQFVYIYIYMWANAYTVSTEASGLGVSLLGELIKVRAERESASQKQSSISGTCCGILTSDAMA